MGPVLSRAEIMAAIRIRKLLDQAAAENVAAPAYRDKAIALARAHPRGRVITYNGKRLLGDDDADGHPDLP